MRREELLGHVQRLGRAFVARGMSPQARKLRVYYLALKYGLTESRHVLNVQWSEDFVTEWLSLLAMPPFEGAYALLPRGASCPRCPPPCPLAGGAAHAAPAHSVRTMLVFPGGAKMQCLACGHAWVEKDG